MKTIFNLKGFVNFLGRHKLYTAINVVGLSVSLVFVVLLAGYSARELSRDRSQANKDRIFLLARDGNRSSFASPIGPDLQTRYPEIEAFCRIEQYDATVALRDQKVSARILLADSTFFQLFSYPLAQGDRRTVLQDRNGILLSENFARRFFGTEDPVGQRISLPNDFSGTVEGTFREFENSHLSTPDMILRYDVGLPIMLGEPTSMTDYSNSSFGLYLMTRPGADLSHKLGDMAEWFKTFFWPFERGMWKELKLIPLPDIYFQGKSYVGLMQSGDRTLNLVFLSVALLILLFAVINYINLSLAQASFRAPEMGTRRLLGSSRGELFLRLVLESVILCAFSFGLALLLCWIVQPAFNRMLGTEFSIFDLFSAGRLAGTLGAVALLGVIAGVVPAGVISRYRPIEIVRGEFRRQSKMLFSKVLIGVQYLITIVLIGCSLVMYRQIRHMVTADLGHDTNNILVIQKWMGLDRAAAFREEVRGIPGVEKISQALTTPFDGGDNSSGVHNGEPISFQDFAGDSTYFDLLGIEVLRDNHNASPHAVWLNEAALRAMHLSEEADSYTLGSGEHTNTIPIAGIVKDFRFRDFTTEVGPAELFVLNHHWSDQFGPNIAYTLVKISGNSLAETRRAIEKSYDRFTGGEPFKARFSDEVIEGRYRSQQRTMQLLGFFTLIAVLISALGILAMATFFIRQRSLEIAIRKVFGSTRAEVMRLLVGRFVRIVVVAFVIAVPVVWYLMHQWLSTYTYRIPLGWDVFALAGFFALAIATLTVFAQSWKAASTNPADAIKR